MTGSAATSTRRREALREYERHRRRQIAYGRWEPRIPAGPVREHVQSLKARGGIGRRAIAEAAGVVDSTVGYLLYSDPPSEWIRADTGRALMAVTLEEVGDDRYIDPTGTRRRLQALQAIGWSRTLLSAHLGAAPTKTGRLMRASRVLARNARAVAEVYDRLWCQAPPESTREERGAATRARETAAANGWAPPLAWDDETIDDPDAVPHGLEPEAGTRARLPDGPELLWLVEECGETPEAIAARFGVTAGGVQQALTRARRREAAAS